jgi:RND family efflux transporter MFP subunit
VTYPRLLLLAALLPALAASCKKTEKETALPPATGSNAAPLPSVPKLDSDDGSASSSDGVLRATGSTYALKQAELGPKSSGVLAAVLVAEGQVVKKGQPLFRLDSTNAYLAVKQAEAGLAQARVALSRAELEYNRMKPLIDQGAVSPANWDTVRIGQDQARVGVQQAEANLASVRALAADTTVVAPFAGIVSAKKKDAGETVTMMPVTPVVVLQDISKIEIRTKLSESALTRLKSGDPMQVRFGSMNVEKTIPVDRVNPSVDPLSRTVEIIGVLPNPDRIFKAGMLVDITFPSTKTAEAAPSPSASAQPQPSAPTPTNVPPTQAGR